MNRRSTRVAAALAALTFLTAARTAAAETAAEPDTTPTTAPATDEESGTDTTEATEGTDGAAADTTGATTGDTATEGSAAEGDGTSGSDWTVNTDDCVDPDRANEPIEGTINIGMTAALSGGPAATAFAPTTQGIQAYIDYANENDLVPGYELNLQIGDDQYNPARTPEVVNTMLDEGVHVFTAAIGSPNSLAVMDLLNEECVPQMMALSGLLVFGEDVDAHPWTFAGQLNYDIEARSYVKNVGEEFADAPTVGVFYTNNEFGQTYADAVDAVKDEYGVEVVASQTIEAAETAPPTAQVQALAAEQPSAIIAAPLGAQCPTFLSELANAKAANSGWEPRVYITNTCSSGIILAAAGDKADGVYTVAYNGIVDPNDEANRPEGTQTFIDVMTERGEEDVITTAVSGWTAGEVTVEILRRAAESEEGLTQASIINAARDINYHPSTTFEGVFARMKGAEDGYLYEAAQLQHYDYAAGIWVPEGDLVTDFESS